MPAPSLIPEYIESKPEEKVQVFAVTREHADSLSQDIASMYEAALGVGGVGQPGAEAYPDSDLFSEAGVKATLLAQERMIAVAKHNDRIVGAMVADRLSPYHIEHNSMAVRLDCRGLRIGSALVDGLRDITDATALTINSTELVTHSLASQAAHFQAGYRQIVGFAFCHYPSVFFVDHPESVLWVTRFQGKLVSAIKQIRSTLGRKLGNTASDVVQAVLTAQAQGSIKLADGNGRLSEEHLQLVAEVLQHRTAYVPYDYAPIVQSILFQFEDLLDRSVKSKFFQRVDNEENQVDQNADTAAASAQLTIDYKDGFGHTYIVYQPDFKFDAAALSEAIKSVKAKDKRYILVRVPANVPQALEAIDHLRASGFVFHSYLPLYGYKDQDGLHQFYDIVTLQWIAPQIVAANALPGATDSVIKLHGYPENLSGPLVKLIATELHNTELRSSELGSSQLDSKEQNHAGK